MSNIIAINGSPKKSKSASQFFISQMQSITGHEINTLFALELLKSGDISKVLAADTLLFVFPLYVDSLPAPMIKLLVLLEEAAKSHVGSLPDVFAICNCGFYEAEQNRIALRIFKNFAKRTGMHWHYGIGIGCGGFIGEGLKDLSRGPAQNIYLAFCDMSKALQCPSDNNLPDVFVTPKMPRLLYKFSGNLGWKQIAKKNGVNENLNATPHI